MTCREMVDACEKAFREQLARADVAQGRLDESQWNRPEAGGWSPAQILEHMALSNAPYLEKLPQAVAGAGMDDSRTVRQSWVGKMILKMAGPGGNAPAPKAWVPGPGPFRREVYDRWRAQQERLIALCSEARGKDLGSMRISNPLIKFVRMTLCDSFLILADHTERHVRQIEERAGIS